MGTVFNEGRHPGEFLLSEGNFHFSRDNLRIGQSQSIQPGQLLAGKAVAADVTASAAVGSSNAGNATIASASPATAAGAKTGRYKGVATAATKVDWEDPNGLMIGTSTHGALFDKGGVRLTITAGGTATAAGDEFYVDVVVEATDVEYVAFNPTGTDGSEIARAISLYPVTTAAGETTKVAGVTRQAEINGKALVLPNGITANQTAKAFSDLAKHGLIVR